MLPSVPFSVVVLAAAFILIAVRQVGRFRLQIWQIVLGGAAAVLLTGQISVPAAISYIDPTVILFLIGMFIVGEALTESGYIQNIAYRVFRRARSVDALVLLILFSMGFASMFLLNDTLAIIGVPIVMLFAVRERIDPKLMLLTLAFAVTIGSVTSPIGNPQNLLIASSGLVPSQFASFYSLLLVPTLINLVAAYIVLRLFYRKEFHGKRLAHARVEVKDRRLAALCRASLALLGISIAAYIALKLINPAWSFSLAYIAVIAALPIVLFSERRAQIVRNIDWTTIAFFISLFILVGSVWQSGFLQGIIAGSGLGVASIPAILIISVLGSQLVSNVPMTLVYLKLLAYTSVSVPAAVALAAGTTIAGNLLILGAASNVIIIQSAEKRYRTTLSFLDFAKVGVVLTAINVAVYWAFLTF
ncbi:MAG: anion transporter [Candidatus Micrarchaeota archaeon]|nr:anion transporter [Candidatus Micrarchaeota archaeon]